LNFGCARERAIANEQIQLMINPLV